MANYGRGAAYPEEPPGSVPRGRDRELLLLADDDRDLTRALERRLSFEGYDTVTAHTGPEVLEQSAERSPDLIVLDVDMPGLSGFEVAEEIRRRSRVPILMVTALGSVRDRVAGLERGADDYLVKPFDVEELLARIRALLRRAGPQASAPCLSCGDLRQDLVTRAVSRGNRQIQLTPREFALLAYLMRHPGQVLSRAQIFEEVWGYDSEAETNVIDVFVGHLRKKLGAAQEPRMVHTVRGVGYVLKPARHPG